LSNIPLTKQAEKALKITYLEAKVFKSDVIGTEHLLMAILKDEDNIASQILGQYGINYDIVREEMDVMKSNFRSEAPQSPVPGSAENCSILFGLPSQSFESAGGSRFTVMFGQLLAYWALSSRNFSRPGSVSGLIASAGHSGSQTPQSMHSSGWITSMLAPS